MFNKIILVGNLTRDPELRYTPQGLPVSNLSLAVKSRVKQGEEWKDEVLFIDVSVFGKTAENCCEYLSKGAGALVEGRLRERKWDAPDGQKKSKCDVVAQNVKFLPKRGGDAYGRRDGSQAGGGGDSMPPDDFTDLEPF
ncbi:MAG: single-stranded DNA-binding protein [Nitrospirae bacterium]|nr:single-stranded DNA-binding protein [Nitrospirota bacterium]